MENHSLRRSSCGAIWLATLIAAPILHSDAATTSAAAIARPTPTLTPAVAGPAVVELFTSQGCSSCPPAELVLGSIARRPEVVALAFHVTYWDSSAWRDRFGRPDADTRQAHYVRALGLSSAYTPQAVINGRWNVLGSDAQAIERALASAARPAAVAVTLNGAAATVTLPPLTAACPCTLALVGTRASADTAIAGGENGGRKLREYSIVRSFEEMGSWDGAAATRLLSRSSVPVDAGTVIVLAARQRDRAIVAVGLASAIN
jgi:hypothetical protein